MQGRASASYRSWSPVHSGVMWGTWRTFSTSYTTVGCPFYRELHADNVEYSRWNKVTSRRPNADRDCPGGHPIFRFIAGQLPYIFEERITDSQFFMSDVETVEKKFAEIPLPFERENVVVLFWYTTFYSRTWQRVIQELKSRTLRSHIAHLTYIQYILYHCRGSLVFMSYSRWMSTTFTTLKWPHDVLMQTVTVLGGIQ